MTNLAQWLNALTFMKRSLVWTLVIAIFLYFWTFKIFIQKSHLCHTQKKMCIYKKSWALWHKKKPGRFEKPPIFSVHAGLIACSIQLSDWTGWLSGSTGRSSPVFKILLKIKIWIFTGPEIYLSQIFMISLLLMWRMLYKHRKNLNKIFMINK
jgi:hypothetical protein